MQNNRRDFLKKMGMYGAAVFSTSELDQLNISEYKTIQHIHKKSEGTKLGIGLIGAGGMGMYDLDTCLKHENVEFIGGCDLYDGRLTKLKERYGDKIQTTRNYKDLLKNRAIDAVIIATPDHWHQQISIDAMKAKKHVYCEKPMVHSVQEGYDLIKAWEGSGVVYQVGSQGLSSLGNEKAKQLLAEGALGEINYAEGFWARHSPTGAWQYPIPDDASETTVDWKRYISNTNKRPYDPLRFFRWRNYKDYGTGMSGDLFVHLFSSLHFITSSKGPNQISAMGGLRYWKDGREVPDVLLGSFQYPVSKEHPGFNLSLRCNFVDGTSGTTYLRIVGSQGSMDVKWEEVVVKKNAYSSADAFTQNKEGDASKNKKLRPKMIPLDNVVYRAPSTYKGAHYDHFGKWLDAIRSGGTVAEDPIFGFRAAAPALLCNDSFFNKTYAYWDPENMKVLQEKNMK